MVDKDRIEGIFRNLDAYLIARENWRSPASYADSFSVLAEQGVIPADDLAKARRMTGMRNRLVHLYWDVDAVTVYQTLQGDLDDFDKFKAAVYAYIKRSAEA